MTNKNGDEFVDDLLFDLSYIFSVYINKQNIQWMAIGFKQYVAVPNQYPAVLGIHVM